MNWTENNTLNWLIFIRDIMPDKEVSKKITKFVWKEYHDSLEWTSKNLYRKYIKDCNI